jgi:hypothetical protein
MIAKVFLGSVDIDIVDAQLTLVNPKPETSNTLIVANNARFQRAAISLNIVFSYLN